MTVCISSAFLPRIGAAIVTVLSVKSHRNTSHRCAGLSKSKAPSGISPPKSLTDFSSGSDKVWNWFLGKLREHLHRPHSPHGYATAVDELPMVKTPCLLNDVGSNDWTVSESAASAANDCTTSSIPCHWNWITDDDDDEPSSMSKPQHHIHTLHTVLYCILSAVISLLSALADTTHNNLIAPNRQLILTCDQKLTNS